MLWLARDDLKTCVVVVVVVAFEVLYQVTETGAYCHHP
jgi:hypothetical protein